MRVHPPPSAVRSVLRQLCLVVPFAVAACGGSDEAAAPCEVKFNDPVFGISSAVDATSNAALASVTLGDLRVGPTRVTSTFTLVQSGGVARNAVAEGQTIRCTITCGFGTTQGTYAMTVSRAGYRDTVLTVTARYESVERGAGGCPVTYSKGTQVPVRLSPQTKN